MFGRHWQLMWLWLQVQNRACEIQFHLHRGYNYYLTAHGGHIQNHYVQIYKEKCPDTGILFNNLFFHITFIQGMALLTKNKI